MSEESAGANPEVSGQGVTEESADEFFARQFGGDEGAEPNKPPREWLGDSNPEVGDQPEGQEAQQPEGQPTAPDEEAKAGTEVEDSTLKALFAGAEDLLSAIHPDKLPHLREHMTSLVQEVNRHAASEAVKLVHQEMDQLRGRTVDALGTRYLGLAQLVGLQDPSTLPEEALATLQTLATGSEVQRAATMAQLMRLARVDVGMIQQAASYTPPPAQAQQQHDYRAQLEREAAQRAQLESEARGRENYYRWAMTPNESGGLAYPRAGDPAVQAAMLAVRQTGAAPDLPTAYRMAVAMLGASSPAQPKATPSATAAARAATLGTNRPTARRGDDGRFSKMTLDEELAIKIRESGLYN